ncbi:hypothetical protein BpHYR1_035094 [Brachionus plicatilis]|uniref:Uncharacterized protein n=1 Tax=Brachionus plicatilis TaxID=10195 RepID=A0A3M7RHP3_BRAPC|nr:hypothetical protein BpHYR1_035094 [Brachionus plicatilis]
MELKFRIKGKNGSNKHLSWRCIDHKSDYLMESEIITIIKIWDNYSDLDFNFTTIWAIKTSFFLHWEYYKFYK